MELEKMSIDEKIKALEVWINDLSESSLDELLIEYLGFTKYENGKIL